MSGEFEIIKKSEDQKVIDLEDIVQLFIKILKIKNN